MIVTAARAHFNDVTLVTSVQILAPSSTRRTIDCVKAFAAGFAIACLGCAGSPHGTTIVHMDSVDVMSMGQPFRIFPELPGRPDGRFSASSVMPSDGAQPCAEVAPAPDAWPVTRAATPSRYLAAVALRLPARFALSQPHDIPAESEQFGGILVGSWHDTAGSGPGGVTEGATLGIWVDAEAGYPTIGADTASRQLSIEECVAAVPAADTRVVRFDLHTPEGRQSVVGAVWPIGAGRYLLLLGSAPDPAEVDSLLRALGTIRIERR